MSQTSFLFEVEQDNSILPCITLYRPWAEWVALGWKTIETRTHTRFASLVGKRIAIHAGLKWDSGAMDAAARFLSSQQRHQPITALPGRVLCTAFVSAHRPLTEDDEAASLIECNSVQRYGLILTDLQVIEPFHAAGSQGIWKVRLPQPEMSPSET